MKVRFRPGSKKKPTADCRLEPIGYRKLLDAGDEIRD